GASSSKVNYVDLGKNNKENDKRGRCGEKGHINRYSKNPKKKNQNSNKKDESANAVEQVDTTKITAMVSEMNIEMIRELHMASVTTTGDWCFNIECSTFNLRHNRLGHINYRTMKDMLKQGIISYNGEHKDKCELCVQAKIKRKHFPKVDRQSEILELVHSDICELNGQLTRGGNRYLITFIDDFSRYTYVYLLKSKDQAFEIFKISKAQVKNQRGKKIQILRSDRGGEYFITEFSSYCESHGLIHQRTTSYTPQQNGVAERKNRVLQDMINAMLVSANLPKNLWGEVLLTACHVSNRIITKKLQLCRLAENGAITKILEGFLAKIKKVSPATCRRGKFY
ncbi:retrovirus-related pol polyprotein from transposon TNT 1-94, partial [Tanacetum coccineum]